MRKDLTDQAEAMARLRVQQLGEELRDAGLLPAEDDDPVPLTVVQPPGRHARAPGRSWWRARVSEGVGRLSERLPFATSHLTVLAALAAAALVVVAWVRISASSEAVPVPRARTSAPFPTPAGDSGAASTASGSVVVDVAGKVRHPGVLTLPAGSRVIDAVRRAGGPRGGADLTALNLARVLVDGEQIVVGLPAAALGTSGTASGSQAGAPTTARISLNQATLEQLETLPGVGPVTAQNILDYRSAHGAFSSVDELLDVDGIGEKTLARLAPHLTL